MILVKGRRFFLWGSGALVLSVPLMMIGRHLGGFRSSLYTWWVFIVYNAYLLFVYISLIRRGGHPRDQRVVWLLWLLFGVWYEATIAVMIRGASRVVVVGLYAIGLSLALVTVYFARRISDSPIS